ncbi:FtsH protease activity modulator HflK [Nitrospina gracilis]|uniref:FtsH protease activity modulator HflK n=1 Tax=Nitrospina gracilis TaxID=35801 RepID=UPI001F011ACD|nr:FtsH protease activity modulator HflK [Nitrospina gracilis]MCF8719662.1 membrane protease subunit HflK [Nitrospina gracilis Nb-211]
MSWDDLHDQGPPQERQRQRSSGGGEGGPGGPGPQMQMPQFKMPPFKPGTVLAAILVLLALWILPSVFYFVEQDEEGVVTRFGRYDRTTLPGPHFKFPSPIEHVYTPKVRQVRRTEIGFRLNNAGQVRDFPPESLMVTGDQNIIDIDLVVQYNISDSKNFLFVVRDQGQVVRDAAETVIRGIIGNKMIDEALTVGKAEIQILVKEQMQALLDGYQAGIHIINVQLQDVSPPKQVESAFKDVVSAREDKERMINEAQGYRNAVIPEARGQAAQIVRNAEAYREQVVKKSRGDASRFLSQFEEYKKAPEITRRRIYLETMEEIFPNMNKFVIGGKPGSVLPILPLGKNFQETMNMNGRK